MHAGYPDLESVELGYDVFGHDCWTDTDCVSNPWGDGSGGLEDDAHGTHVAGIIAAWHDGIGMAGIAPGVSVTPVRIVRGDTWGSCPQIGNAIRWAWFYRGADVLNNSWTYVPCDDITNAINDGTIQGRDGKGATIVFAAGNTSNRALGQIGPVAYPANLPSVIAVGAINYRGELTNYTPDGTELDLVAPSGHFAGCCKGDVVTRELRGDKGVCNDGPGNNVDYTSKFTGTSAAAPQVAGVVALLYSRQPWLTYSQVRARLFQGADRWGPSNQFGYGKLNAYFTLVPRVTVTIQGPSRIETGGTYSWESWVSGGISPYSYQWEYCPLGGSCEVVGTSSTYSRDVWDEPDFILVVTSDDQYVDVCMGCGNQFAPPRIGTSPVTRAGKPRAPRGPTRLRSPH